MKNNELKFANESLYNITIGLMITAIFCAVITILGFLVFMSEAASDDFTKMQLVGYAFAVLVTGAFLVLLILAMAFLIPVIVKIELNTRNTITDEKQPESKEQRNAFDHWKINNPGKTINDFYKEYFGN